MPVSKKSEPRPKLEPYWRSECGRVVVYVGDCREVMEQMEPEQFHAVVTDPPYSIGFMGRDWDNHGSSAGFQTWFYERAESMLRVAKPGAHLLSFGGTRMWHRMACAVEDAGWEIRDTIMWVYGSGFPKSMDVSKAIDKTLGVDRDVVGTKSGLDGSGFGNVGHGLRSTQIPVTEAASDAAKQWDGWGTCLKPALEPIVMARKSFGSSVAQCVMENGCGGLNIDGCRVGTDPMPVTASDGTIVSQNIAMAAPNTGRLDMGTKTGRWPANLIHDGSDEVVKLFPTTGPGAAVVNKYHTPSGSGCYQMNAEKGKKKSNEQVPGYQDSGSTARFFYTSKANDDDRPHGKDGTVHPTVKPLDLMQYLVRLVCAKGGTVLDPFMGSGSTGCAAVAEGMRFVGIEQSQEYADIAVGRLRLALQGAPAAVDLKVGATTAAPVEAPPPPRKLRS